MAQLLSVVMLAWIALLARAGANADELTPDLADAPSLFGAQVGLRRGLQV